MRILSYLRSALYVWFVLLVFACNNTENQSSTNINLEELRVRAMKNLSEDPLKAVNVCDTAIKIIVHQNLDDSLYLNWTRLLFSAWVKSGNADSGYSAYLSARDHFRASGNIASLIGADLDLAENYVDDGKYIIAQKYLDEGLDLAEQKKDDFLLARACNISGSLLRSTGKYSESITQLVTAVKLFEKLRMPEKLTAVYLNIGLNYEDINAKDKALTYYRKSLQSAVFHHDTVNYLSALNNLGAYYRFSSPDSAEYYFKQVLKTSNKPGYTHFFLSSKFNLANVYYDKQSYAGALKIYREVGIICLERGIYGGMPKTWNAIANIFEGRNQNDSALFYYQLALKSADSLGDKPTANVILSNIQMLYEKMGEYAVALKLFKRIKASQDSLLSLEKQVAVHDLEMLYHREKSERENQQLTTSLQLMKNRVKNITFLFLFGIISLIVLSLILVVIYKLYKERDHAYQILFEQMKSGTGMRGLLSELDEMHHSIANQPVSQGQSRIEEIISYLESEKPYTNSRFRLGEIAQKFNVNSVVLSNELYSQSGMHFNALINSYRVAEVLRLMSQPESASLKIETIAMKAGFGSRAAFYSAFVKFTGKKPSEYRREEV